MCQLQRTEVRISRASQEESPGDKAHVLGPLSVMSSFQALEKACVADLSGSQDRNKHDLNNLRLTTLEAGQENYPLEKVKQSMPLAAPRRCVSHFRASGEYSLSPGPRLDAWEKEIARCRLRGVQPQASVPVASLLSPKETEFESRSLQLLSSLPP